MTEKSAPPEGDDTRLARAGVADVFVDGKISYDAKEVSRALPSEAVAAGTSMTCMI